MPIFKQHDSVFFILAVQSIDIKYKRGVRECVPIRVKANLFLQKCVFLCVFIKKSQINSHFNLIPIDILAE